LSACYTFVNRIR